MALSFVPTEDDTPIDPLLIRWATPLQLEALEAVAKYGGNVKGAERALGLANDTLGHRIRRLRKLAASKGYSPPHGLTNPVPDPFYVSKVSTLRNRDGEITAQWVQAKPGAEEEAERLQAIKEALLEGLQPIKPLAAPAYTDDDLLTVYPQGDPHAGLYAWKDETGQAFDLAEYERVTKAAIDRLVASAAPSAHALFIDLGDSLHADNNASRTKSGHHLDPHGRHAEVVRVVIRCKRHHIARLLEKHRHVAVRINPGNHDGITALMLAEMMALIYENEPRVTVATSPNPYWYFGFGTNLIGTTHGDGAKGKDLPLLMAVDAPDLWQSSQHGSRVWYVGHVHHGDEKDYPGVTVKYKRTLAAPDIWSHASGYRSKRSMDCETYHRTLGEVERHTCGMGQVERMAA